uniref:DNA topoisomerase 2 n=1 Tax=Strigamia maritima TaxID=126957 RepID=T1IP94_STRMM
MMKTILNSVDDSPPMIQPKDMGVERIYQKKTQLEHILLRPDTYIGSVEPVTELMWIYDNERESMVKREITYVPGLFKIFDEILVNAADNKQRDKKMDCIKIEIDPLSNLIVVYNNGQGIPVVEHKVEKMFVPTLIFGHLLTSSNFNDEEKKVTGGRNGYGAKLCNVFSTKFVVETACKQSKSAFKQTWTNNMTKTTDAKIKGYTGEDFTRVSFSPDLSKFNMTELNNDIVALFSRRAYDIAGCSRGVKVFLNGKRLPVKNFKDYIDLYVRNNNDEQGNPVKVVYETVNDRWEVAIALSDHGFQQVSFVNSIATTKGGRHVDYAADHITSKLIEHIKKKNKSGINVKPFQVKSHLWVFLNCLIENPTFDSQTKENMTLQYKNFGSKCTLSEKFITQVLKSGVVEAVLTWMKFKQQSQLDSKCHKSKHSKLKGIPKLEDANKAGTKFSTDCTLILTEGDSAKSLAVSGLGVIGRDNYGVFPLRGKMLNVREATHKQILENAEINNLIKIVGLQYKKKYESVADLKSLRYGKVMIMADQDQDGSHIKGLVINFIHYNWPDLLRLPFLEEFITPIVKVTKKDQVKSFYSIPEFEEWKKATDNYNTWRIRYYKGLGTSSAKEAKEYFSDMERHRIIFKYSGRNDDSSIQLAFSKKMVEQRKEWLTNGMDERKQRKELGLPEVYLYGKGTQEISYQDFVNKELILFSNMDNERSIPSLVDGMKPGQRKVMFACFKRDDKREVKVIQLAGSVSEQSAYHHGEQSLNATIINLAQNFVGSNNINLLQPIGQFGTRLQGGKDAASPRYIHTMLSPVAKHIFNVKDQPLLNHLNDDNLKIEPEYYVPIIPMILVNGSDGIGTGWMTRIPNYNPREIVTNIKRLLAGDDPLPMKPWFKNFMGTIEQLEHQRFVVSGEVSVISEKTLEITELPIRVWTQAYKEAVIEPMLHGSEKVPSIITDYKEYHTDTTVRFLVSMSEEKLRKAEDDGLHKLFKLQSTMTTTSMVLFDHNGCLKRYESVKDILMEFFQLRLEYYIRRKSYLEGSLKAEAAKLSNQARFIIEKIEGKIIIENKKKVDVISDLVRRGFESDPLKAWNEQQEREKLLEKDEPPESDDDAASDASGRAGPNFTYLLNMSIMSLTKEKKDELLKERDDKLEELHHLQSKFPSDLWKDDLNAFIEELDRVEAKEREDEASGQIKKKPMKPGKYGLPLSRAKKPKKFVHEETKPSPDGRKIEPRIDSELKRKVEKAAATAASGIKKGLKRKLDIDIEENGNGDGEFEPDPKPLLARLQASAEKKSPSFRKGLKTVMSPVLGNKFTKKRKKSEPWEKDSSGSDSDNPSDVELRKTLSTLPHEGTPKRASASRVKYTFDSDSSVIMSDGEREEGLQAKSGRKKNESGSDSGDESPVEQTKSKTTPQKPTGNNIAATATSKKEAAENSESDEEKESGKNEHKDDDQVVIDSDGDNVKSKVKKTSSNNAVKKNAAEKKDGKKKSTFDSLIGDKGDSKSSKKAANNEEDDEEEDEEEEEPEEEDEDDAKSNDSDVEFVQEEEEEEDEPEAKPAKKRGRKKGSTNRSSEPSDEDEFVPQTKKKASRRPPALRKKRKAGSAESDESTSHEKSKKTVIGKNKRKKKAAAEDEDDDGEQMGGSMAPRARSARSRAPVKYNFAEVLAASRSRAGWRSSTASSTSTGMVRSGTGGGGGTNKATTTSLTHQQGQTQPTYLATVKCNYETGKSHGGRTTTDGAKKSAKTEAPIKPPRATGSKVSSIANMFQNMSPSNKSENTYVAKPGVTVTTKIDSPLNERAKSKSQTKKAVAEDNKESNQVAQANIHLNRTESHLARFNNARAMFERLEEESLRSKTSCGVSGTKKRSGSVSPMRSSPTVRSSLSSPPMSPGADDCSEKNGLSPKEKSLSADSILERSDGAQVDGTFNQRVSRTPQQASMVERARNGGLHLDLKSHADGLAPKGQHATRSLESGTKIPTSTSRQAKSHSQDQGWQQKKKEEKNAHNTAAVVAAAAHVPSPGALSDGNKSARTSVEITEITEITESPKSTKSGKTYTSSSPVVTTTPSINRLRQESNKSHSSLSSISSLESLSSGQLGSISDCSSGHPPPPAILEAVPKESASFHAPMVPLRDYDEGNLDSGISSVHLDDDDSDRELCAKTKESIGNEEPVYANLETIAAYRAGNATTGTTTEDSFLPLPPPPALGSDDGLNGLDTAHIPPYVKTPLDDDETRANLFRSPKSPVKEAQMLESDAVVVVTARQQMCRETSSEVTSLTNKNQEAISPRFKPPRPTQQPPSPPSKTSSVIETSFNGVEKKKKEPEVMTPEEANRLLSSREDLLSDEEAHEVTMLLSNAPGSSPASQAEEESEDAASPSVSSASGSQRTSGAFDISEEVNEQDDDTEEESGGVHYFDDGHFWIEVPGLLESDQEEDARHPQDLLSRKRRGRVRFSCEPIKVYSTFSVTDYDRRNDEVDPVSASAEYELEKRVERMDVAPVELIKGPEGLGLSIIGMGVGADAGLEKLGIFVKTITEGGAAHKDGRIQVNDQIIEVDGKSLVGVTQAYAASVLRNTSGLVRFLIGREKDGENSEVAQLISQSLQADREREDRRKAVEQELQQRKQLLHHQHEEGGREQPATLSREDLTLPIPRSLSPPSPAPNGSTTSGHEDSTPEEGEDLPTCEVFDLEEEESSDSPSPDDVTAIKIKMKEAQYKSAVAEAELAKIKARLVVLESVGSTKDESERRLHETSRRLEEVERILDHVRKEVLTYQEMLEESQGQYMTLEKKYYKAKKLIREFQEREQEFVQREDYQINQLQEKDNEYNALVKALKDRVIQLETDLTETQRVAGLPVRLPYDSSKLQMTLLQHAQKKSPPPLSLSRSSTGRRRSSVTDDSSDTELSDSGLDPSGTYDISPDSDEAESKTSTVERKPGVPAELRAHDDELEKAVPSTELLDSSAAKTKAELASKGSLANRQPPTLKKTPSTGSSDSTPPTERRSSSDLLGDFEDLVDSVFGGFDESKPRTPSSPSSHESVTTSPGFHPHQTKSSPGSLTSSTSHQSNLLSPVVNGVKEVQRRPAASPLPVEASGGSRKSPIGAQPGALKLNEKFAEEMKLVVQKMNADAKSNLAAESGTGAPISPRSSVAGGRVILAVVEVQAQIETQVQAIQTSSLFHRNLSIPVFNEWPKRFFQLPMVFLLTNPVLIFHRDLSTFQGESSSPAASSGPDRRAYRWQSGPVSSWSPSQVGQWLLFLGLEQYIGAFIDNNINGLELVTLDSTRLKTIGVANSNDRSTLKKKLKELKVQMEKERKAQEKEIKAKEKLQKKAEKAAEKALGTKKKSFLAAVENMCWEKGGHCEEILQMDLLYLLIISLFLFDVDVNGQQMSDCGVNGSRRKRIVGGERVAITNYPWIAELRHDYDESWINCGAVIIHKYFVLTSAHCFKWEPEAKIIVTYGTDSIPFESTNSHKAVKLIRHPKYTRNTHHDDIMLIKLDGPIQFTPDIQPICLPEHKEDSNATKAKVLGFGRLSYNGMRSDKLRAVELKIVPNADCFNSSVVFPTNICAGGEVGKDSCQGDSGAPLVLKKHSTYYLIGVVSWGVKCAEKGVPGVYTRISAYIDWIYDVIKREVGTAKSCSEGDKCECGLSSRFDTRIVGGERASIAKYPFFVGLQMSMFQSCGGALLNGCYVLTAGHCTKRLTSAKQVQVIVGAEGRYDFRATKHRVAEIIRHPNYLPNKTHDDIALLRLAKPVSYTERVHPICLPKESDDYVGKMATVIGFGYTKEGGLPSTIMREVDLMVIDQDECKSVFKEDATIYPNNLCAGGKKGKDACLGDSGGPFIVQDECGRNVIVGVVSWGVGCARNGIPGVYTQVNKYLSWIEDIIKSDAECCHPPKIIEKSGFRNFLSWFW